MPRWLPWTALGLLFLVIMLFPFEFAWRLWAIPAPSRTWVDLIVGLAWPAVLLFGLVRYAPDLRRALDAFVPRLGTDDVKVAGVEVSRRIRPSDEEVMWLGWVNAPEQRAALDRWIAAHCNPVPDTFQFISSSLYATHRSEAAKALKVPHG